MCNYFRSDKKSNDGNDDDMYDDVAEEDMEEISPLRSFLEAMNPINLEEWPEMRWWVRAYEVFKVGCTY